LESSRLTNSNDYLWLGDAFIVVKNSPDGNRKPGSLENAGTVVGRPGDGGIDGVINQDRLGIDRIYVQAKRWRDAVGSPEIMKFSGALTKKHASRGVFIASSAFTRDALEYIEALSQKIVLIDGKQLISLQL
jgi:restriction system protein